MTPRPARPATGSANLSLARLGGAASLSVIVASSVAIGIIVYLTQWAALLLAPLFLGLMLTSLATRAGRSGLRPDPWERLAAGGREATMTSSGVGSCTGHGPSLRYSRRPCPEPASSVPPRPRSSTAQTTSGVSSVENA